MGWRITEAGYRLVYIILLRLNTFQKCLLFGILGNNRLFDQYYNVRYTEISFVNWRTASVILHLHFKTFRRQKDHIRLDSTPLIDLDVVDKTGTTRVCLVAVSSRVTKGSARHGRERIILENYCTGLVCHIGNSAKRLIKRVHTR